MAEHKLYDGAVTIKFDGRAHAYTWREKGLYIPGVTKILSRHSKDALLPWAAGRAADYIEQAVLSDLDHLKNNDDITVNVGEFKQICKDGKASYRKTARDAADIGKRIHKFAELWLKGEQPDIPSEADERIVLGCNAFLQWIREHDVRPLCPEKVIFSRHWLFAGTCDLWGYVDGELTVGDFKTSKAVYIEHLLQTAAYQIAIQEELRIKAPVRRLIRLDKTTGEFHVERHPPSLLHEDAFLRLREFHEGMSKIELSRKT